MLDIIATSVLYISILSAWLVFVMTWKMKQQNFLPLISLGSTIFAWVSLIILGVLFVSKDYSYTTVFNYVSNSMTFSETLSATWVSRAGIMILWGAYMLSISYYTMRELWTLRADPIVKRTLTLTTFFGAMLISFALSTRPVAFARQTAFTDGIGLAPSLLSFWNIIHPPIAFLAYASFIFPYAAGLAILTLKNKETEVHEKLNWLIDVFMILGWCLTSLLLVAGSIWGYEENWNGFWAFDPVENAALVMWSVASIYFHVKSFVDEQHLMRAGTATLGWTGVAFAAFITRSGLLSGLHTYSSSAQTVVFGIMLLLTVIGVIYGMLRASSPVFPDEVFTWQGHKNKVTLLTFWLLIINATGNTVGLVIQLLNKLINNINDIPYWYYVPLNAITLIGLGLLLPFCEVKIRSYLEPKKLFILVFSILISLTFFYITNMGSIYLFIASIFLGTAFLLQLGEIFLLFIQKKKLKLVGRYIIHLSTILMILSYYSADFYGDVYLFDTPPGEEIELTDYGIVVVANRVDEEEFINIAVTVSNLEGKLLGNLLLEQGIHLGSYWNRGDRLITPLHDLFFHIPSTYFEYLIDPTADIVIEVHRVPNVNIFRASFIFIILATFLGMYSYSRRRPQV